MDRTKAWLVRDKDFITLAASRVATVTARTTSQSVAAGTSAAYLYDVTALNGLDGSTIQVMNQGVYVPSTPPCLEGWNQTANWNAASHTGTVALYIQTTMVCPSGFTFYPQITWVGGGVTKTTTGTTLTMSSSAGFSITVTPGSEAVTPPASALYTVIVSGINATVNLGVSGLPSCATMISGPGSVTGGSSTTFTIGTTGCQPGTSTITVTGTSAGYPSASVTAALVIQAPSGPPVTATPSSNTIAPTGVAGYAVTVNASAGFSGAVSFGASGLPAGATASFSPQTVNGSGSTNLSVATTSATPLGTFPITVWAQNGTQQQSTMVLLTVVAASPSTMISPAPGSNLASNSPTFLWNPGTGASQNQLTVGSTPGASDYYSTSLGAGANAYCQDGTFACQSATVTNVPVGTQRQNLYARLSSLVSGTWQFRDYSYTTAQAPPLLASAAMGKLPQPPSSTYWVLNDGSTRLTGGYCIGTPEWCDASGYCNTVGCDINGQNCRVATLADVNGTTCRLVCDPSPTDISGVVHPVDATNVTACTSDATGITAQPHGSPSSFAGGIRNPSTFDVNLTVAPMVTPPVATGDHTLTCTYAGQQLTMPRAFTVDDATPAITAVDQLQPLYPGGNTWITIWGTDLGGLGSVKICVHNSNPCVDSGITATAGTNPNATYPYLHWDMGQVNAFLSAPLTASPGGYDVQLTSLGETGLGFVAGPQSQSTSQSSQGGVVVSSTTSLSVTISGDPGVPLSNPNTFSVSVGPNPGSTPIGLSIVTTGGTGSAQFSNGTTSMTVSGTTQVAVTGTVVSSTANNLVLRATDPSGNVLASFPFSVVTVAVSLNLQGQPALDDDARAAFLGGAAALGAGVVQYPTQTSPHTCGVGVEIVGTVSPSNYAGTITLRRSMAASAPPGALYIGQEPYDTPYFTQPPYRPANADDTSDPRLLDAAPQSCTTTNGITSCSTGRVYDIDAPGIGLMSADIYRYRANFIEYAVLGNGGSTVTASTNFAWWARVSCTQDQNGTLLLSTDVSNDNKAGTGTTPISWDLQ